MKITIDLEDFWSDDESGTLSEQIKEAISSRATQEVWKNIEKKVNDFCDTQVKKSIEELLYSRIRTMIADLFKSEKVKKRYSGNDMITMEEYIKEELPRLAINGNTMDNYISALAKKIGDEVKNRYDVVFAQGILQKMQEHDLLNKDAAAKLLGS